MTEMPETNWLEVEDGMTAEQIACVYTKNKNRFLEMENCVVKFKGGYRYYKDKSIRLSDELKLLKKDRPKIDSASTTAAAIASMKMSKSTSPSKAMDVKKKASSRTSKDKVETKSSRKKKAPKEKAAASDEPVDITDHFEHERRQKLKKIGISEMTADDVELYKPFITMVDQTSAAGEESSGSSTKHKPLYVVITEFLHAESADNVKRLKPSDEGVEVEEIDVCGFIIGSELPGMASDTNRLILPHWIDRIKSKIPDERKFTSLSELNAKLKVGRTDWLPVTQDNLMIIIKGARYKTLTSFQNSKGSSATLSPEQHTACFERMPQSSSFVSDKFVAKMFSTPFA